MCIYSFVCSALGHKSKSQSLNVARAIIKNQLRYVIAKHVAIKINVIVSHTLSCGPCALNNCALREEAGRGGWHECECDYASWGWVSSLCDSPLDYCNCFVGGCFCVWSETMSSLAWYPCWGSSTVQTDLGILREFDVFSEEFNVLWNAI